MFVDVQDTYRYIDILNINLTVLNIINILNIMLIYVSNLIYADYLVTFLVIIVFFSSSSIADETVANIEPADDFITFTVVDSGTQRAKRKLVDSHGYTYNVKVIIIVVL